MNSITEKIFKNKVALPQKLLLYGFIKQGESYVYKKNICDNQMEIRIATDADGNVDAKVFEFDVNDYYTLFLDENAAGGFVGGVRAEYETVLRDIAEKCFVKKIFKSAITNALIEYVRNSYGDELEFLWEKFTDNAIWRRSDNKKWYAAVLTVSERKLGLDSDRIVEVVDLRMDPNVIKEITDGIKYFGGYHMNKKHWITIRLDGSVNINEICRRLDESYKLAK